MEKILFILAVITTILIALRLYIHKSKSHQIYKSLDSYGAIQILDSQGLIAILYRDRTIDWQRSSSLFKMIKIKEISDHFEDEYNKLKEEEYNSKVKIYEAKASDLKSSALIADKAVKNVMAERLKREAEKGNVMSASYNSLVTGFENLAKGIMYDMYEGEDILRSAIGQMDLTDKQNKVAQEKYMSGLISSYADKLKARGVSEEYLQSTSFFFCAYSLSNSHFCLAYSFSDKIFATASLFKRLPSMVQVSPFLTPDVWPYPMV
jgi:hypothetical protein